MKQADNENPTVLLRRLHRWRMAFFGLVILLAGITIGVAGTLLVFGPPEGPRPMPPEIAVRVLLGRFRDQLNITDDQADQIRTILRTRMQNLQKLREEARPKIEEQLEGLKEEISAVLTAEQSSKWQEIINRLDREFRHGMRPGPGGPDRPKEGFRERRERFRDPNRPRRPDEHGPWRRRPGGGPRPFDANRAEPNRPDHSQRP
jgi:hypothetical protein